MLKVIIFSLVAIILGCLFHFTYALSHKNKIVAIFSAVNESVWEHIKIGISGMIPVFLVSLFWNSPASVVVSAAFSTLIFIALIPALFYPICAIMGRHSVIASILEFAASIFVTMLCFDTFVQGDYTYPTITLGAFLDILILLAWGLFTFYPPKFFLFRDSTNGQYGLKAHSGRRHHRH